MCKYIGQLRPGNRGDCRRLVFIISWRYGIWFGLILSRTVSGLADVDAVFIRGAFLG